MPPPSSDRALRRLVADLAAHSPASVAAVLNELDAGQRETVLALLGSYHGMSIATPLPEIAETPRPIAGLSSWLQMRLDGHNATQPGFALSDGYLWDGESGVDRAFVLTPIALEALRACASNLQTVEIAATIGARPPSFVDGLRHLFSGSRS